MRETLVKNVTFPDPNGDTHTGIDVLISRWNSNFGTNPRSFFKNPNVLHEEERELVVLPAAIDAHVHFREPGLTHKETIKTGSLAAREGGVLAVLDMPNTVPWTDNVERILDKKNLAIFGSHIQLAVAAALTDQNFKK